MRIKRLICGGLTACLIAGAAQAQDWQAVVIGQPGTGAATAFADAFHVSEVLRAGGFEMVQMLRDVPAATVRATLNGLRGQDRVLIYVSGALSVGGDAIHLRDDILRFSEILATLQANDVQEAALLVEDCADPSIGTSGLAEIDLPPGLATLIASSAGPGGSCAKDQRLTDRIRATSDTTQTSLQQVLDGLWVMTTLSTPVVLDRQSAQTVPSLDAPVVSVIRNDVVALAPVSVSKPSQTIGGSDASSPPAGTLITGSDVVVFEPPPQSQIAAIPVAAGLPEPSIIVGLIETLREAAFDPADESPAEARPIDRFETLRPSGDPANAAQSVPEDLVATEITYENLEARRALRQDQPGLFAALIDGGAFDPPADLLTFALQNELARMGCYTAEVDGIWGNGSRQSVAAYFEELDGVEPVTLEPEPALFRQIIQRDDVVCDTIETPAPAPTTVASPPPRAAPAPAPQRQAATPPRTQPQAARPSAPPSTGRTIQRNRLGSGVFR